MLEGLFEDRLGQVHCIEGPDQLRIGRDAILLAIGMHSGEEGFGVREALLDGEPLEGRAVVLGALAP